jgi:ElaB/YqjD/DUF883 family membrane-anchored ribosome-binding protein
LVKEKVMTFDEREAASADSASTMEQAGKTGAARLQRAFAPVRDQLTSAYTAAQEKSNQALQGAEMYVKRSPLKALAYTAGIAALIGVVGGALFGRRTGGSAEKNIRK